MSGSRSDKSLLRGLNAGTASAARKLDEQYRAKLEALAQQGLDQRLCRREDPEDVVQSVLRTVFRRVAEGQLHFDHGGQVWRLLEKVTRHKILKHAEYQKAKKRSPKAEEYSDVEKLFAQEPTAQQEAITKDFIAKLLEGLDQTYIKILLLLMEDHSERAIAQQMGCTRRAVMTKIERLRKRLQKLLDEDHDRVE